MTDFNRNDENVAERIEFELEEDLKDYRAEKTHRYKHTRIFVETCEQCKADWRLAMEAQGEKNHP